MASSGDDATLVPNESELHVRANAVVAAAGSVTAPTPLIQEFQCESKPVGSSETGALVRRGHVQLTVVLVSFSNRAQLTDSAIGPL